MNDRSLRALALAAAVSTVLGASPARATGETWDLDWTPANGFGELSNTWSLTAPGSAYAAWNVFSDADPGPGIYDFTPEAGSFGLLHAFVYETGAAGAFLTGGGNIYSFSAATSFETYIQGSDMSGTGVRDVALRLETLGTSLAAPSVKLDGVAPTSQNYQLVGSLGGFGGAEEEWVFVWKNVTNAGPLSFSFNASGSSMSLGQAAMYYGPVGAVPEPHEWALMLAGLGMVQLVSRARRQRRIKTG